MRSIQNNEKVENFNFALCLEAENEGDDTFISSLIMFAKSYTFVINRDKFRTACKLLRVEKVDFFKIVTRMLISEASQQPLRVLREIKDVVFRSSSNEPS